MAENVQGSITIKRLKTGDSINFLLNTDKDLFQVVDPTTGSVVPLWTTAANQPTITPKVTSVQGATVALSDFVWKNGGTAIVFGTATNNVATSTTPSGTYKLNTVTGALTICKNLASSSNVGEDVLTCQLKASVNGIEYTLSKDISVRIQSAGSSSYSGSVSASTTELNSATPSATLTPTLYKGTSVVAAGSYWVKWFKDSQAFGTNNNKSQAVTRADVTGLQLFICKFYSDSGYTKEVASHGVIIVDTADEFQVLLAITSANQEVAPGKAVTVTASVYRNGVAYTLPTSGVTWDLNICDSSSFSPIASSATNTIDVTTTHTDRNNAQKDVIVTAEVTF